MISKLQGGFETRTPADLKAVFDLRYNSLDNIKILEFEQENPNRLTPDSKEFFISAFTGFNNTFPDGQCLGPVPNSFMGNYANMSSIIEYFIRTLIMAGYESGITVSLSDPVKTKEGEPKGRHDLIIYRGGCPALLMRYAKLIPQQSKSALEQSYTSLIFSLYSEYHKSPIWPLYGLISDLNTWEFLKYDGTSFYRSPPQPLFLHAPTIYSLSQKILPILDSPK